LVEKYVWGEVEEVLDSYTGACLVRLEGELGTAEQTMESTIARARNQLERCKLERQRLLTALRKGYASEAEIDLQFKAINSDEGHWQEELAKAEAIRANAALIRQGIVEQAIRVFETSDWWWDSTFGFTPEQKKEVLNAMLDKFILYRNGKIELRLKVPASESQLTELVAIASRNDVSSNTQYGR